jgi:hypothetical protein
MKKLFIFSLFSLLLIVGCKDDEGNTDPGTLTLNFLATYDSQPLVMNQLVDYNGQDMRINVSEFYISEIQLSNSSSHVDIGETEYVQFSYTTGPARVQLAFDEISAGSYDELRFFIGVPADLNMMTPEDFSSTQALSNSATYWQGWQSYIFSKLEGRLDTLGNGSTDLTFIYHSGKDELYTEVVIPLTTPLVINSDNINQVDLRVEHKSLFKRGDGYLDIKAKPTAHNADDLEYPTIILDNFKTGIKLD